MTNWREQIPTEEVIQWRRHFHQHPELSFEEIETSNYIYDVLSTFPNLELSRPTTNSVIAKLTGSAPGKTIALRADIDALPIEEEADVDFKSKKPGIMHACGHDTHAAMLLGAAKVLSGMKDQLSGVIKFIFQPAEEVPPGGAKAIVDAGVLDDVDYVFGIHIFPKLPAGMIGTNVGAMTAAQDIFELKIQGKGSHGSTPELSIDPITIGAEIVTNLNNIVSRHVSALDNAVLSIGQFTAGEVFNVIPDTATLKGTVRTTNAETRKLMKKRIHEVIDHIVKAYNGTYELHYLDGYSAVVNHEVATDIVRQAADKIVGEQQFTCPKMMGSEDFAAYTDVTKGSFFVLGGGTEEEGCGYMNHHPKFKINEDALAVGMQMHVQIALDVLGKK
ncbi:M20 metallopeptidase family protein [Paenibacillus sp. 1001270B_150601_E10]|uniref:M20 metallopeptidase family protein n=1 Tax=Paenibacillus sp. 1001270B_150601_E10 TaxID=2787079 RepID=UPI00189D6547|nr:amidohydrolase [Paenibacillus sp. 1001270B_150601_E10]